MSIDILESLNATLGGPVIRQLGASLGESDDTTRSAVRSIGPTLLAGLMQHAATPSGANEVLKVVNDERIDPGIAGKLDDLLGNRGSFDSLRGLGEELLARIFGNRSGAITNAISQTSGVRPGSALSLLSMGLPVLLGILRKQSAGRLDAHGITSLLSSQRRALERTELDSRIANALGVGSLSNLLKMVPGASGRAAMPHVMARESDRRGWQPWAIAAGVAALALLFFFNRTGERADVAEPARTAATPAPTATRVYFETGETVVDSEDRIRIASIADAVKADDRAVGITGYLPQDGDPDQQMQVAQDRVVAVRDALVAEGVAESKIVMDPPAEVTGATAEARRVDIELR